MAKQPTRILVASDWAPIRAFDPVIRSNPAAVYGDLLPALRSPDLRIVNCESALTRAKRWVWKSGSVFKGEPEHVKGLTAVPFDVACLANNHVLDYGIAGLRETLQLLRRNGVRTLGAGLTEQEAYEPLRVTVKGTKVHIVNFSEGEDLTASHGGPGVFGWDIDRAVCLVARCRRQGGVVIAIGHCGLEYVPYPPPYVAAAFRAIADAGASCVIGHHPHVPQGIEWRKDCPIVYSLGNFVFYQPADLLWRRTGFCASLLFDGTSLSRLDMLPYRITGSGLRALGRREEGAFRRKMAILSSALKSGASTELAWQAYLEYYGTAGFTDEVLNIVEKMRAEPPKGAAMFRNRITTMQHRELWRDVLTRSVNGGRARYSREALRTVREWFTKTLSAPASRRSAAAEVRPSAAASRR